MYKEFEIAAGVENVKLGTTSSCEFRLNPETFFSEIEIEFTACSDEWNIDCADQLYFSKGDMRKLYSMEISHGDIIAVCYSNTGNEAFELRFMIDFEAKVPNYNWYIDLPGQIEISSEPGAAILLKSQFEKNIRRVIQKKGKCYYLDAIKSAFGVLRNGQRIEESVELHDCDFFSVDEYQFYFKEGKIYFDQAGLQVKNIPVH